MPILFQESVEAIDSENRVTTERLRQAQPPASNFFGEDPSEASLDWNTDHGHPHDDGEYYFQSEMEMSFRELGDSDFDYNDNDDDHNMDDNDDDDNMDLEDVFFDANKSADNLELYDDGDESLPSLHPSDATSGDSGNLKQKEQEHPDAVMGKGMLKAMATQGAVMLGLPYIMGFFAKFFRKAANDNEDDVAGVLNQAGGGLENTASSTTTTSSSAQTAANQAANLSQRQLMMQQAAEDSSRRGGMML